MADELASTRTRRFLFSGHVNGPYTPHERKTLGFTRLITYKLILIHVRARTHICMPIRIRIRIYMRTCIRD